MPAVIEIVAASAAMALIVLSGSITLALPGPVFSWVVLPLVAGNFIHIALADLTTTPALAGPRCGRNGGGSASLGSPGWVAPR